MDTCHGNPHIDHLYLPEESGRDGKEWLEDGYSYTRMKRYIEENWKMFADLYIEYNE